MKRAFRIAMQWMRLAIADFWCAATPEWASDEVVIRRVLHAHTQETKLNLMKKGLL